MGGKPFPDDRRSVAFRQLKELSKISRDPAGSDEDRERANEQFQTVVRAMNDDARVRATRSRAAVRAKELKQLATIGGVTTCEGCGWTVPERIGNRAMHLHHVIPVANGGNNKRSNLAVICPNCHVIAHALIDRLHDKAPQDRDELIAALKSGPLFRPSRSLKVQRVRADLYIC